MQVLVLAVQNAVPYDMLGVATSGATLFRSIGGSLGTAVLGAIFTGAADGRAGRRGRRRLSRRRSPAAGGGARGLHRGLHRLAAHRLPRRHGDHRRGLRAVVVHPGAAAAQDGRDRRRRGARRAGRHRLGARAHARAEPRSRPRADAGVPRRRGRARGVEPLPGRVLGAAAAGAPEAPTVAEDSPRSRTCDRPARGRGGRAARRGAARGRARRRPRGSRCASGSWPPAPTACAKLIDDWEPDEYPELDPLLRRLADELAAPG